jgi:hypothetical protein
MSYLQDQPRCRKPRIGRLPCVGGGSGRGRGRAFRGDKPRGFFSALLAPLTSSFSCTRCPLTSSFSEPVVFLPPSYVFALLGPLPSSFGYTRCPLPSFYFVHSLPLSLLLFPALATPSFLVFCTYCPPSLLLAIASLHSKSFALSVPLPSSARGVGTAGAKNSAKMQKKRKQGGHRANKKQGRRKAMSAEKGGGRG